MGLLLILKRLGTGIRRFPARLLGKLRKLDKKFKNFLCKNGKKKVETKVKCEKKFVGITLNSLRDLEIYGDDITVKLLAGIWKSGFDLKRIETVVITNSRFIVTSSEFCDFLKNLSLKSLEITDGTFSESFLTDNMLRIATESVKICSANFIRCFNVTSDLIDGWMQHPNQLLNNFELENVELGFKLTEILFILKKIEAQPSIEYINWNFGVFYQTAENERALLKMYADPALKTHVKDIYGMQNYQISLRAPVFKQPLLTEDSKPETYRCKITFWMKELN